MFDRNKKYYKIFKEDDIHHGFQYKDGLNIDTKRFNNNPHSSCVEGGFYFTDADNICNFLEYGIYIREVEIPKYAKVVKDPEGIKWRANRLFLHERRDLSKIETWEWMIEQGIDIHVDNDYALTWATDYGYFDIVKYLVENSADIHTYSNRPLGNASSKGHIELVKYLVEKGADINAGAEYPLELACEGGHFDIIKYFVEKGANIHAHDNYALKISSQNAHIDVVKYLIEKGADIHVGDNYALRWSLYNEHIDVAKYLIDKGADIHWNDNYLIEKIHNTNNKELIDFLFRIKTTE